MKDLLNGDKEYTMRLSPVSVDSQGNITACGAPLNKYLDRVVKKRIRLRYVMIRVRLFGRDRDVLVGIRVAGDISS